MIHPMDVILLFGFALYLHVCTQSRVCLIAILYIMQIILWEIYLNDLNGEKLSSPVKTSQLSTLLIIRCGELGVDFHTKDRQKYFG